MGKEAQIGCLMLQCESVGAVVLQLSEGGAAVAGIADVVAVVGTGLRLLGGDGHYLIWIIDDV
jgi:hypothetical protein